LSGRKFGYRREHAVAVTQKDLLAKLIFVVLALNGSPLAVVRWLLVEFIRLASEFASFFAESSSHQELSARLTKIQWAARAAAS